MYKILIFWLMFFCAAPAAAQDAAVDTVQDRPADVQADTMSARYADPEAPAAGLEYDVQAPAVVLRGHPVDVTVKGVDAPVDSLQTSNVRLRSGTRTFTPVYLDGTWLFEDVRVEEGGRATLQFVQNGGVVADAETRSIPGWLSILPPLLAILMALVFRRVIPALFFGIWIGAWMAIEFSLYGLWMGMLDTFNVYVLNALADADHAAIILFSLMIGGMVGIIQKNGGAQGVVDHIVKWASTARRGQLSTASLGLAIFFDDYANTLVVGNTMRSVTDKLRISREKLAYLVDSTAAPVSCLAFVTTWIGYEVALIGTAVAQIEGLTMSAYGIFLQSIPYSFYPILAIFFVFLVAYTGRDFGPMYRAEVRARKTGAVLREGANVDTAAIEGRELIPKSDKPFRALNAIIPVLVLVIGVLVGLYVTGEGETLKDIIGSANSYTALMWGSLLGVLVACILSVGQRILTLEETVEAWYAGLRAMLFAMIILVLAWSLSEITEVLHTADYLVAILGETVAPGFVPAIVFILAAATAFATGSSWGTMGILMPLVVPLSWAVLQLNEAADPAHYYVLYSTVSCVLAGAVWGDHCSPISDTTILSSMASGCDHIDHVRTQLPYAFTVGITAIAIGTIPTGFGFPWWISLVVAGLLLAVGLRMFGKPVEEAIAS